MRTSVIFGAAAVAAAALSGCQPIGEWTGRYVPRQPEVAGPAVAAVPAMAAPTEFYASLAGTSEVPMNFSDATGSATADYDEVTGVLTWSVSYESLSGEAAAAHFHGPAAEGENAGVQVNLGENGLASPIQGSALITPEQASQLLGGLWYANIHTPNYPDGEIRGQLAPGM